ncbi:MAG: ExbD/TolR family protein [Myxococcota bacterium]
MAARTNSGDDIVADINVTPLVDIMLVLLIIFMLTSTSIAAMQTPKVVEVNLPAAASAEAKPSRPLSVVLNKQGQLFLDGKPTTPDQLRTEARSRAKIDPKVPAILSADRDALHGNVIQLMDLLRLQGVTDIAVNTKAQDID